VKQTPDALYHLFPQGTAHIDNTAQAFEGNLKTLLKANKGIDAETALKILHAGMDNTERIKTARLLGQKTGVPGKEISLRELLSQWEEEVRPQATRAQRAEAAGIPKAEPQEPQAAPRAAWASSLATKDFYEIPDKRFKERHYQSHLDAAHAAGYYPPRFSIESGQKKPIMNVSSEPGDGLRILNPFSDADLEKMKAAARIGVKFIDPSQKQEQLAFMQKNLPEVYAIIQETLKRQEKEQQLVIGDTRTAHKEEQKHSRKSASYSHER
jgi:hypothetical protein